MPKCETCIYFGTDGDCDGLPWEWCELDRVEAGYHVGSCSACNCYVEREDDDDDWE